MMRLKDLPASGQTVELRLADFYEAAIDAQLPEATRPGCPHPRRLQRPHRRIQQDHQADQTRRLWVQVTVQLSASYPRPHRGHPTAEISGMNGSHPAQVRRSGKAEPDFSANSSNRARVSASVGRCRPAADPGRSGPSPSVRRCGTRRHACTVVSSQTVSIASGNPLRPVADRDADVLNAAVL
jgi:hypothetical protein